MKKTQGLNKKAFLLIGISFEVVILLMLFIWLGQKADRHFHTNNFITMILVILALFIWFYQLIRLFGKEK